MTTFMSIRGRLVGVLVVLCGLLGARGVSAQEGGRPNILFIMTDDHAAHAISAYGSKLINTPNMDRLAKEGMLFKNAFVTNALCGPSRAVVMTGKYSHANGFLDNKPGTKFDSSQQTMPKLLKAAGYQTAVVGKWHLNSDPVGFDYWSILPGQGIYNDPFFVTMGKREKVPGHATDVTTDKALKWLEGRDPNKPFFLMYHHKAPHRPWVAHPRHQAMFKDKRFPLPATFNDDWKDRASAARYQEMTIENHFTKTDYKQDPPAELTPQQLKEWKYQRYMQDYLACVAGVDENIGRVLDYLDREKLAENTIVVYTSDNGFFLGDHGWYDKRFMYEESLKIPLLVRYPKKIKAGSVSEDLVINADYAPTFLDYAGVKAPEPMHGRSLRGIVEGNTPGDWRQAAYYHYYEYPQPHRVQPHYGVRTHRYKLIHYYAVKEWELFDLEKDPNELKNVYDDPAYAGTRDKMNQELERLRKELKDETGAKAAG